MSNLVIELIHNITRTWDLYGGPKQIPLFLKKEAFDELRDSILIASYPKTEIVLDEIYPNTDQSFILSMNGYDIKVQTTIEPVWDYFKNKTL